MTAPRMTDEELKRHIQDEAFATLVHEVTYARAAESAALARVRRLEALLKRVPQVDCHPSEGRHSPLCREIRATLSEET